MMWAIISTVWIVGVIMLCLFFKGVGDLNRRENESI